MNCVFFIGAVGCLTK